MPEPWVLWYATFHAVGITGRPGGWHVTIYNPQTDKYVFSKGMYEINHQGPITIEEAIKDAVNNID